MTENRLTARERADIAIEAGMNLIPNIGGALAALYFGTKNEKRLKRVESFYQELKEHLNQIDAVLPEPIASINRDQLVGVLESINDEMETASAQNKRHLFCSLYSACLLDINNLSWNRDEFYEDTLSMLNVNELQVLFWCANKPDDSFTDNITAEGLEQSLVDGYLTRLTDLGLLDRQLRSITIGTQRGSNHYSYRVTQLARDFIKAVTL